jgi:tetratricopeptide (TPR) repeat protein
MQAEPPRLPSRGDVMTSGPLPTLEGFDDQGSQSIGTQLAMATAYVQAEDYDAALRVYRRIIRKPGTSQTVLRMIGDDLGDLEDMAQDLPRYYQVVGDLLLRLGRHKEAIEAYDKIR